MDNPVLPVEHAETLARKLRDDQLVLFAGAGISHLAPRKDGTGVRLPLWDGLAKSIAQEFFPHGGDCFGNPLDLFDAVVYEDSRGALEHAVRQRVDDGPYDLSDAHHALKELPWHAIMTTNYDGLLGRLVNQVPVDRNEDYDRLSFECPPPRLFHIHGTLQSLHTLTREDYRLWRKEHPRAWKHLEGLLLYKTVLFVGYSLSDPHIDELLAVVRRMTKGREKRLYAWMWDLSEPQKKLMDRRDKINAIRFDRPEDYARAFHEVRDILCPAAPTCREVIAVSTDTSYDREQYRLAMWLRFGKANVRPIYVPSSGSVGDDIGLTDIFVVPDLEAFAPGSLREDAGEIDDPIDVTTTEEAGEDQEADQLERSGLPAREPADDWLARSWRLLVVGDPGQGKTSLLQHWLLQAVEQWKEQPDSYPLPVLIPLTANEERIDRGEMGLVDFVRKMIPRLSEVNERAVATWIRRPVLWLLDGLDEIRNPLRRQDLRQRIAATAATRPDDRWVLSCRPCANPAAGLDKSWTVVRLASLSDDQMEELLRRWAVVLKEKEHLDLQPRQMAQSLQRDPGLRRLCTNSLLLTLAILFYKGRHRLPEDRWEFYEHADRTLREAWLSYRMDSEKLRESQPGGYLPTLLASLALRATRAGQVDVSRHDIEEEARRLLEDYGYREHEQEGELARLLAAAEDMIGVLVARGPGRFGFLHLTFQEYFAARALRSLPADDRQHQLAATWDRPDWSGVWALYVLSAEDGEDVLEAMYKTLSDSRHSLDKYLCRPERACLGWAGLLRLSTSNPRPGLNSLLTWAKAWLNGNSHLHRTLCLDALVKWEKLFPDSLARVVVDLFHRTDWRIPHDTARALASQTHHPLIQRCLLARLDGHSPEVKVAAAIMFSGQPLEGSVRDSLVRCLSDDNVNVREAAADVLCRWVSDPAIAAIMLEYLQTKGPSVRRAIAGALHSSAGGPSFREALLERLHDPDPHVREAATRSLGWDVADPSVRDALLGQLQDDVHVRKSAVRALSREASDPLVRSSLLGLLGDREGTIREAAATALARVAHEPSVRDGLRKQFGDSFSQAREAAACSLSSQARDSKVCGMLMQALSVEDWRVRQAATIALTNLACESLVRGALLLGLVDKSPEIRYAAVGALSRQVTDPLIRETMLNLLNDPSPRVRRACTDAFARHPANVLVGNALMRQLHDGNSVPREETIAALVNQVGDDSVCNALLGLLEDSDWRVRRGAVDALFERAQDPRVEAALLQRLENDNWQVRVTAARTLARQATNPKVQDALLRRLRDDNVEVSQVAMMALERAILSVRHEWGTSRPEDSGFFPALQLGDN